MTRSLVPALLVLGACNGDGFSKKEAQTVAEASASAQTAAYSALEEDMTARDSQADLEWVVTDTGYTFSGTITSDGPDWTGTMHFDGSLASTDTSATWTMDVELVEVTVDGTTLDGDLSMEWAVTMAVDSFSLHSSTQGTITATGEANGTGTIDTSTHIEVGMSGMTATVTGTVDGHEVDVQTSLAGWGW